MISYLEKINHKSKKRYKKYKTFIPILESVDTIVIIGATSTSLTLSVAGTGLVVVPVCTGLVCFLSLVEKLLHKIVMKKHNK